MLVAQQLTELRSPQQADDQEYLGFAPFWGMILGAILATIIPLWREYFRGSRFLPQLVAVLIIEPLKGPKYLPTACRTLATGRAPVSYYLFGAFSLGARTLLLHRFHGGLRELVLVYGTSFLAAAAITLFYNYAYSLPSYRLGRYHYHFWGASAGAIVLLAMAIGAKAGILLVLTMAFSLSTFSQLMRIQKLAAATLFVTAQECLEILLLLAVVLLGL